MTALVSEEQIVPSMRYSHDLRNLKDAYATARHLHVDTFAKMIAKMAGSPLVTVGSGGSYSTASFAAFLHELHTRAISRPVTPLEMISTPIDGTICG